MGVIQTAFIFPLLATMALYRELELLALEDLVVVDPEEVAVQHGLDDACNEGDPVHLMADLREVAVDPVRDVQSAVQSEGKQIVRGDGLGLPRSLQHEQLRQDGNRLQPDGEGPQDLSHVVSVRENNG